MGTGKGVPGGGHGVCVCASTCARRGWKPEESVPESAGPAHHRACMEWAGRRGDLYPGGRWQSLVQKGCAFQRKGPPKSAQLSTQG